MASPTVTARRRRRPQPLNHQHLNFGTSEWPESRYYGTVTVPLGHGSPAASANLTDSEVMTHHCPIMITRPTVPLTDPERRTVGLGVTQ
jgi:hypothetical protein